MKFVDAIKAMGPGQLLQYRHVTSHEPSDETREYELKDGYLVNASNGRTLGTCRAMQSDNWFVVDKPRPRVRFAEAMRAAAKGATIKSCESQLLYAIRNGAPCYHVNGEAAGLSKREAIGDWEIIEPEGEK